MNFSLSKISKLSLAMLTLVSAAFFVVPAKEELQAQGGGTLPVKACFNPTTKAFIFPSSTGVCPSGSSIVASPRNKLGFCVFRDNGVNVAEPPFSAPPSLNSSGTKCVSDNTPPVEYADFVSFASIQGTYNPGGNSNTNNGNVNNSNANNSNGNSNTGGSTTPPRDGCETGFHKLGPLCVPNSPVGSNDSILGEQTAGGLATRIIRILLYFAGIVAVIMAIVGGYHIMTAGGNATQAANGRKTLTNAIIGLAIIILSFIIIQAVLSFIT